MGVGGSAADRRRAVLPGPGAASRRGRGRRRLVGAAAAAAAEEEEAEAEAEPEAEAEAEAEAEEAGRHQCGQSSWKGSSGQPESDGPGHTSTPSGCRSESPATGVAAGTA